MLKQLLSFIFISCLVLSCSTEKPRGKTAAEVLYKEAQEFMADSRFILATERLNTLRSQFPYSYYSTHAELLQADILFEQENFVEAAGAYIVFKDFHPKHKNLDYVVNRISESYYNQLPDTFDRDLSPAYEAIRYSKEVLRLFPSSKYAQGARDKINKCEDLIRQKEKYIADFYFKTLDFSPARYRYRYIIENIKEKSILEHSVQRVIKASLKLKDRKNCVEDYDKYSKMQSLSKKVLGNIESDYKKCLKLIQ